MEERIKITAAGKRELEEELERLKVSERAENVKKIAEARAQGDLSENAEYDAARDKQGEIEARIKEIEATLRNADVISDKDIVSSKVGIGSKVIVTRGRSSEEIEYKIVGPTESNVLENKISNESPVGAALIGHRKGDVVKVETPGGNVTYKIVKVGKAK